MEKLKRRNECHRLITFVLSTIFLLVLIISSTSQSSNIVGDINDDGVVNLEEAIYALQVAAGHSPSTILDQDSAPSVAAWGSYTYNAGTLSITFTFSNFSSGGPPIGTIALAVDLLTATTMDIRDPSGLTTSWTRETGNPNEVIGEWERTDTYGNIWRIVFDSNGSLLYSARGVSYTTVIDIPQKTITIDGNFTDWNGINSVPLFLQNSDCGSAAGKYIQDLWVTYDDNYIYIKMDLNGEPVPTYGYKFGKWSHSNVSSTGSCGIASGICGISSGCIAAFGNSTDGTAHQYEARIDKCLVEEWDMNYPYYLWIDQGKITDCRTRYKTPILNIDYSNCD